MTRSKLFLASPRSSLTRSAQRRATVTLNREAIGELPVREACDSDLYRVACESILQALVCSRLSERSLIGGFT